MDLLLQAFNFIYNFIFGTAYDVLDYVTRGLFIAFILVSLVVITTDNIIAAYKKAASAWGTNDLHR